jgi:hypothetical protein
MPMIATVLHCLGKYDDSKYTLGRIKNVSIKVKANLNRNRTNNTISELAIITKQF